MASSSRCKSTSHGCPGWYGFPDRQARQGEYLYGNFFLKRHELFAGRRRVCFGHLKPGAHTYVFTTLDSAGTNRHIDVSLLEPNQFMEFNGYVRSYAAQLNATVLDAYAISLDAPSTDGLHFLQGTNVDKVQIMLNLVAALHRERDML